MTATLNLTNWRPGTSLLDYLFKTGQVKRFSSTNEKTVLEVINRYCMNGHEMTKENIYTKPKTGKKECSTCRKIQSRNRTKNDSAKFN